MQQRKPERRPLLDKSSQPTLPPGCSGLPAASAGICERGGEKEARCEGDTLLLALCTSEPMCTNADGPTVERCTLASVRVSRTCVAKADNRHVPNFFLFVTIDCYVTRCTPHHLFPTFSVGYVPFSARYSSMTYTLQACALRMPMDANIKVKDTSVDVRISVVKEKVLVIANSKAHSYLSILTIEALLFPNISSGLLPVICHILTLASGSLF